MTKRYFKPCIAILLVVLLSLSALVCAPVSAAESVPTISVSKVDYNSVKISWDSNYNSDYKVAVYYSTSQSSNFELAGTTWNTGYTVSNLEMNKKYYFKVCLYDTDNYKYLTPYSNVVTATTKAPESSKYTPSLSLFFVDTTKCTVLVRRPAGALSSMDVEVSMLSPGESDYVVISKWAGDTISCSSLIPGSTYKFRARFSQEINDKTYYSSYSPVLSVTTASVDALTPVFTQIENKTTDTSIRFALSNLIQKYESYVEVEYAPMTSKNLTYQKLNKEITGDFSINELQPGTSYCVRGRTVSTVSGTKFYSGWSTETCFTTAPSNTPVFMQTDVGIKAGCINNNVVRFGWNASSGATAYRLYKVTNGVETLMGTVRSLGVSISGFYNNGDIPSSSWYVRPIRTVGNITVVAPDSGGLVAKQVLDSDDIHLVPRIIAKPAAKTYYKTSTGKLTFGWNSMQYADGYEWKILNGSGKVVDSGTSIKAQSALTTYKFPKDSVGRIYVRGYARVYLSRSHFNTRYGSWSTGRYISNPVRLGSYKWNSKKKCTLKWNYSGAYKFDIYASKKAKSKGILLKTQTGKSYTFTKYSGKAIDKSKNHYYITIVAHFKDNQGIDQKSCSDMSLDAQKKIS